MAGAPKRNKKPLKEMSCRRAKRRNKKGKGGMCVVGKAETESECLKMVNKGHPYAAGATVRVRGGGDERHCLAVYGMTGTVMIAAGHKQRKKGNKHETCFFRPRALLEKIANGEMTAEDEDAAAFIADETEIDQIADEVEEKELSADTQVVEEKDACDPCDSACVEKVSQESFVKCDADKNNKLSAKEIQDCSVDTGAVAGKWLALGELDTLTDAKLAELVAFYDADKDDELTPDEWLKAEAPCPSSLKEEGTVISEESATSEETEISGCVGNKFKRVVAKKNFRCKKTTRKKACSLLEAKEQTEEAAEGTVKASEEEATDEEARENRWGGRRRRRWNSSRRRWVHKVPNSQRQLASPLLVDLRPQAGQGEMD